jgi:hypothetical protein
VRPGTIALGWVHCRTASGHSLGVKTEIRSAEADLGRAAAAGGGT